MFFTSAHRSSPTATERRVETLNTLFLNAVSEESHRFIDELDRQGHETRVANSFQSAMTELTTSTPEFMAIDASLEFASSDALIQIKNAYRGKIAAYGRDISPDTKRLLMHMGISYVVDSIFDLAMFFPTESHERVLNPLKSRSAALAI